MRLSRSARLCVSYALTQPASTRSTAARSTSVIASGSKVGREPGVGLDDVLGRREVAEVDLDRALGSGEKEWEQRAPRGHVALYRCIDDLLNDQAALFSQDRPSRLGNFAPRASGPTRTCAPGSNFSRFSIRSRTQRSAPCPSARKSPSLRNVSEPSSRVHLSARGWRGNRRRSEFMPPFSELSARHSNRNRPPGLES